MYLFIIRLMNVLFCLKWIIRILLSIWYFQHQKKTRTAADDFFRPKSSAKWIIFKSILDMLMDSSELRHFIYWMKLHKELQRLKLFKSIVLNFHDYFSWNTSLTSGFTDSVLRFSCRIIARQLNFPR